MAAKSKPETQSDKPESPAKVEGVLTISQFEKLTDAEKQAFREANGTVTNDPTN